MMAEVFFHLKPEADADRRAERQKVLLMRRLGYEHGGLHVYLSSDEARKRLAEIDERYFRREFFEQADPDSMVQLRCPNCRAEHIVPRKVREFECRCTPHRKFTNGLCRADDEHDHLLTRRVAKPDPTTDERMRAIGLVTA